MPSEDDLMGKRILVVEDDYLLAREVCSDLQEHGACVVGPAPTVHYARLILGKRKIDGAVLDINLFGEEVYQLVDSLLGDSIPVIFATAYDQPQIAEKYRFIETLHKPICLKSLRGKVARLRPLPGQPAQTNSSYRAAGTPAPFKVQSTGLSVHDRWSTVLVRAMRASSDP